MSNAAKRIQKRKKALNTISALMNQAERVIVLHYSCEGFYDRPDGSSSRVVSIAVRNLGTGQTISFSVHQIAEREGIPKDRIEEKYVRLERLLLDDFYEYARGHLNHIWVHWNMRDSLYGFQAIAHRYRVLRGQPVDIHEANLVELSRLLKEIYGVEYIEHPHLQNLAKKNNIFDKDFLFGADEAVAFDKKEYVKLHQSTNRKVDVLSNIIEQVDNDTLKTNATWKDLYGNYPVAVGEFLKDNWVISIIAFISTIAGIIALFLSK